MNQVDREFLKELRQDFVEEAGEYLHTMESRLLDLERNRGDAARPVEELFRAAHSLKGAAQAVELPAIASACQAMESVFSRIKKGSLKLGADGFDLLQRAADTLAGMVDSHEGEDAGATAPLVREIEGLLEGDAGRTASASPASVAKTDSPGGDRAPSAVMRTQAHETVRIASSKLDSLLLKAQELIAMNISLAVRIGDAQELLNLESELEREWNFALASLSREGGGARSPVETAGFMRSGRRAQGRIRERLRRMENSLRADHRMAVGLADDLIEDARTAAMLPLSSLLSAFPKIVRDLSRDLGKEVEVVLLGGETEVDKRVLEGLKDPLVHLVRNCVDHGLERPEERRAAGKAPSGRLTISASQVAGGRMELLVSDDGRGIDAAKLRKKAVESGGMSQGEAENLDDASALELIFRSGFSTSAAVTEISGRGLGMAILREGVEGLGGRLSIESERGRGSTFRLNLPLALATLRGVLVEERGWLFVIPSASIERVGRVDRSEVGRIGRSESILVDGVPVALAGLGDVLEMPARDDAAESGRLTYVMVEAGGLAGAFRVDRVLDEREMLMKSLGSLLARVRNVAGATVLGTGEVVPVLNSADLVRSLRRSDAGRTPGGLDECARRRRILVVEDSITSRTLLRSILTAAGYDVGVAVDGQEAWEFLSVGEVDAVVADVEMPRMNGLELVRKMRSEPATAALPVLLVTSLESEEDRERGAEAGADAYIVKSGFDGEALLEALHRLL